jgi:hypothetical protein
MSRALRLRPELGGEFEDPGGIVAYEIDPLTGQIASGAPNARRELFIQGAEPSGGTPLPEVPKPERETPIPEVELEKKEPERPPDSGVPREPKLAGIDTDLIPLPPEARGSSRPPERAEPTPTPKRSLMGRIKDIFTPDAPATVTQAPGPLAPAATTTPRPRPAETPRLSIFGDPPGVQSAPRPTPTVKPKSTPQQVATRPRKVGGKAEEPPRSGGPKDKFGKDLKLPAPRSAAARPTPKPELKKTPEAKKPLVQVAKTVKPSPTPRPVIKAATTPTPVPTPAPTPVPQPIGPKEKDTFVVEVCSETGLLPVAGVCTTKIRKRFNANSVPTKSCSRARHGGN